MHMLNMQDKIPQDCAALFKGHGVQVYGHGVARNSYLSTQRAVS